MERKMQFERIEGLIAAPFTPMDESGSMIPDFIPEYYDFLVKNNVKGVFVNGSTGEGASLSQKEKELQITKWAHCNTQQKKLKVINLVGGTSYEECIDNAKLSMHLGISAISIIAPYYFKPASAEILAEFVARIGESVPDMPVYFYHIPVLTGVNMPMIDFLRRIASMLPNFAGIKYTNEDFADYLSCLNFDNKAYDILWGRDECYLSALVLGAKGAVGSTFNYAAPLYNELVKYYNEGLLDEARALQQKSIDMISILSRYGGIATGKAFMKYLGLNCGQFRLPVKNMSDEMYEHFLKDVAELRMEALFSKL